MDNEFISLDFPLREQRSSADSQQHTHSTLDRVDRPSLPNNDDKENNSNTISRKRKETHWLKYHSFSGVCAFAVFTIIATTVGVTTICLTSPKDSNGTCDLNFKGSGGNVVGYDSRPHQVAVGDCNEDGHLDIAVANSGIDCIGILLGFGNGTFAAQLLYSTGLGSRPYSVAIGDFNNDTRLDIVVANYGINGIGILLGYGNGSFAIQRITSLGSSRPVSIAIGYFNKDNSLDIAAINDGTLTVAILLGSNDGSFRIDQIYNMGYDSIPYSIAVADLNQDKKLDLAIVNYGTSELALLLTNENGSFIIQKYSTGDRSHPSSIAIGNFNDDNILDIAVANSGTSNVGIFLGNGNGTFRNLLTYPTGSGSRPQSLIVGDFNNDAHLDIATVDSGNDNVLVLQGSGNGSFSIKATHSTGYSSNPSSIAIGDFDNDNKSDVAIANNGTNNILVLTSFVIYPYTNQANYSTGTSSAPYAVDVADFNKDNYLDIVVANSHTNNVGVFINYGNGTFTDINVYYMGDQSRPFFVATGDFNNDTNLDIVVALTGINEIGLLFGYGDGTFLNGDMYSTGYNSMPYTVAVGDFNNDGNLDIIISNYWVGSVGLFFGFGDGTFTNMISLLAGIGFYPKCVGVGNFNNDKILDIAASNSFTGGIAILLGRGNGSFQDPIFTSTDGDLPNCFTIGNLNRDNRSDIVYTDSLFSHVGVLLGNGNGTFESTTRYLTVRGSKPWFVALGYYNEDFFLDMAVSNPYDSSINIFLGTGNGSFGIPQTLSTGYGSWPWSVVFGDVDNDNQQDIVVANDKTNIIIIFFVLYDADFANETSYMTGSGSHPYSVTVGNLDNNEQLDIVVANSGDNTIELLLDYNHGTFTNKTVVSIGLDSHPQCVIIVDFNKDHLLDIAVVNSWYDNMNVYLGSGDGSFDAKMVYSTGSGSTPNSIAAGDFNKDGRMDIVIANQDTDNVVVFLAFDYATFTYNAIDVPGFLPNPFYVATGDFNNDDRLDVAVINTYVHNVGIYLGFGNGTFSEQISFSTSSSSKPFSLAVGDFNNDTYLDIVVANADIDSIGVFLGYGNGSFQSQIPYLTGYSSQPQSVAIGDFNNDSRLDIVAATYYGQSLCIFLGYGNGSFAGPMVYPMSANSYPTWVTVGDLNNDNILDIAVANYYADNVCILFGYGDGSFGNFLTLLTGDNSKPNSITIGDLNKDKSLDIAVANLGSQNIGIFFGYGNGTFSSQKTYPTGSDSNLSVVVMSDINNDTIPDILVADYNKFNSSIGIFYGFGNGNFTLPTIYPTGVNSFPSMIAVGDFNNDSRVDLAINYENKNRIGILLQLKPEPFASSALFPTGNQSQPTSAAIGDFNNDDQLDIAVANSGTNNIGILLGYGDGDFDEQLTYSTGTHSGPVSIAVGDFNHDNHSDIVVVNAETNTISILFGCGNGIFSNITTYSTGMHSDPSSVVVGDLNKDNNFDLVVANWGSNNILVFLGRGDGTFFEPKSYSVGYDARPQSVAIGDINNDDLLDIVVTNYGGDYVEILWQNC